MRIPALFIPWTSLIIVGLIACEPNSNFAVSGVTLDSAQLNLYVGGNVARLVATISPSNASNKNVTWSTDNVSVVTVSEVGVVTPVGEGSATVTVTTNDGAKTASCNVVVAKSDTTPPGEVTGLSAEAQIDGSVLLSWTDPSDGDLSKIEIGYQPNWTRPIQVSKGSQKQFVTGLISGIEHTFTVWTIDNKYNKSAGVQIKATPKDKQAPAEVSSLAAVVASGTSIQVSWTDPTNQDLKEVELSYTNEESESKTIHVNKKVAKCLLNDLSIKGIYTIRLVTIDQADNKSAGVSRVVNMPDALGVKGWALNTGGTSFVEVPNLAIPENFTLEAWIFPSNRTVEQMILSKQQAVIKPNQFRLAIKNSNIYFMMTGEDLSHEGSMWDEISDYRLCGAIPVDIEWIHVAVTKNVNDFKLYINSELEAEYTETVTPFRHLGNAMFEVGANVAEDGVDSERFFSGIIDEVRIWDIARLQADIQADMNKSIPSTHAQYSHLVAYYKFNEGAGNTTADIIGNHPATLVNAPKWESSDIPIDEP